MHTFEEKGSQEVRKKILLIEDNNDTQLIFKVYLRSQYDIEIADTAEKGIELLNKNKYDLLILDINLPGKLDGNDVLNEINKQKNIITCPVLVVTAYTMNNDKENFLSRGADGFLSKPVLKSDFLNEVNSCTAMVS
ncbi:MAG TPA: response regulator [Ignavibacteriaceae bacterium]|nr:response regulator [Ignavibacteriaceae bacterium]